MMRSRINKILGLILILVLVGFILLYWKSDLASLFSHRHPSTTNVGDSSSSRNTAGLPQNDNEVASSTPVSRHSVEQEPLIQNEVEPALPESLDLEVPFVCQAPLGDWNPPFGDACEEANILMVHYYLEGEKSIESKEAAGDIEDLVAFEVENYGFYESTTAEQTAQLIRDYYGYKVDVYYDISLEDIKEELTRGNLVIVPAAGRMLGNPYYTPPGPLYHMLLIKGYTQDNFIVNDAGTKRGADYTYSYSILKQAIHDWNSGDVENGRSAMIVIQK